MPEPPATTGRPAPALVWVAVVLAVLGVLPAGALSVLLLFLSMGLGEGADVAWCALAVGVVLAVLAGAGFLATGRSWLVLVLAGAALAVLVLAWSGQNDEGAGAGVVLGLTGGPGLAAVLAALPGPRAWVTARR